MLYREPHPPVPPPSAAEYIGRAKVREVASSRAAANVMAANIVHASTLRRMFEPVREPMRVTDYIGAAVITLCAVGLFYFAWGVTP